MERNNISDGNIAQFLSKTRALVIRWNNHINENSEIKDDLKQN